MNRNHFRLLRRIAIITLALAMVESLCSGVQAACEKTQSLFFIERSKNRNVVNYDVCLKADGELADGDAVHAYWVLEDGAREDLNMIEQKYAYGVTSQERLSDNKVRFTVAGFERTRITVEKIGESYRAVARVKKKEIILKKVYVKSKERTLQTPKVLYVDVYGSTVQGNQPVKEHITPK